MLNELHDLAECLKSHGVLLTSWHQHFKPCPNGTATYLTMLDVEGRVVELQAITDRERVAATRKWEVENGVSFPGFNVLPLYGPRGREAKKAAAALKKALVSRSPPSSDDARAGIEAISAASDSLWVNREAGRIDKCLTTHVKSLAAKLGTPPPEYSAIAELLARVSYLSAENLHHQVRTLIVSTIVTSPTARGRLFDLLFFHSGKSPKRASLILELADSSKFDYPANHEVVQAWMNAQLHAVAGSKPSSPDVSETAGCDAYASPASGLADTFPSVRLPVLGNVILRAMSSESPCQKRYGLADSKSCPVGQVSRQEMKNALEWIGHPDRQGKTWGDVSTLDGVSGLLFAYPSQKREVVPELAGLIVGLTAENDPDGARFEACAKQVTAALTGEAGEVAGEVRVFVLSKPDGFRTKVVHSDRYAVSWLLKCADEWQQGARNIPWVRTRQFGAEKGDKAFWADPWTPFPAEIAECLNTVWDRGATNSSEVRAFGIKDALGLLLERRQELQSVVARSLHALLCNSGSLLLAIGQAHHQSRVHLIGGKHAKQPRILPTVLGVLLAKLGRKKGDYMKGPPFLVGRLLSLADQLHAQYCHSVRKGQVPPQLVGNALMATALEQPQKAIAILSQRLLPYQAWANTVREGDNVGLAKYLLGQLGRISVELKGLDLSARSSDADKAEMLLGYLAHSEKDGGTETNPSTIPQGANT